MPEKCRDYDGDDEAQRKSERPGGGIIAGWSR